MKLPSNKQKNFSNGKRKEGMGKDGWQTVFSSFKMMFGEHVTLARFQNMIKEMMIKVPLYNTFTRMV